MGPLFSTGRLVREGLLAPALEAPLERLRLRLKRSVAWRGQRLGTPTFETRRHWPAVQSSTS